MAACQAKFPDKMWAVLLIVATCSGCVGPVLGPIGRLGQPGSAPAGIGGPLYTEAAWQTLLLKHVATGFPEAKQASAGGSKALPGLVDYGAIFSDPADLNAYLDVLSRTGPRSTPQQFRASTQRLAYYINAYNASAIRAVLEQYPTQSVHTPYAPSFEHWWRFRIDGKEMTLDQIRQAAFQEAPGDVRILFALCDAAVGDPPLAGSPYRAENLSTQLQAQLYTCLGMAQIVDVSHAQRQLQLWWRMISREDHVRQYYKRRYGSAPASLLNVLMELSEPQSRRMLNRAVGYRIVPKPFDRRLNRLAIRTAPAGAGPARTKK